MEGPGGDMLLTPPVGRTVSAMDWKLHSAIKDMAYQWGLTELDRLRQEEHPLIMSAGTR
jgi:hypothetical protein